jgi:hypothetical protein
LAVNVTPAKEHHHWVAVTIVTAVQLQVPVFPQSFPFLQASQKSPLPISGDFFITVLSRTAPGRVEFLGENRMSSLGKSMSDINLGMLYLAREVLQKDEALGLSQLGISREVANPALLQLMNKGRECGWVVTLAVQTLADLEHAQGSRSGARMLLGNAANIFAFRTLDQEGRQWLMDRLSSVWLAAESHSSGSQWSRGMMGLQGKKSDSRSWHYQELPMIPESLLASLPNFHYMGLLAGQTLVAGRVPLIRQ